MLVGFVVFGIAVGIVNRPQAAVLAELFPVAAHYTGVSVAFQLAAILGGAVGRWPWWPCSAPPMDCSSWAYGRWSSPP
jgi:hypothetical protein